MVWSHAAINRKGNRELSSHENWWRVQHVFSGIYALFKTSLADYKAFDYSQLVSVFCYVVQHLKIKWTSSCLQKLKAFKTSSWEEQMALSIVLWSCSPRDAMLTWFIEIHLQRHHGELLHWGEKKHLNERSCLLHRLVNAIGCCYI